mmetsp:Transcript_32352/g.58780  ORF Transcript_32352/g.58780 Transcript_32352/m.58780 type:complete len:426 (-) Transcript_32352:90-1367(-)
MHLFAGCYERFLFGFSLNDELTNNFELKKKYTFAAHKNAVKCVASAGSLLASGGNDDLIHLYDLKSESDLGVLMNPGDGAIPCLDFFLPANRTYPTHLLSGSSDGGISIWHSGGGGWDHQKLLKGHRAAVNSISIHPTGKLALSTSKDNHLRMWNLIKGRGTYTTRIDREPETVCFNPSGAAYTLLAGQHVSVHNVVNGGSLTASIELPKKALSLAHVSDDLLLLGLEDGSLRLWDVRAQGGTGLRVFEGAHGNRIRGLSLLRSGAAAAAAAGLDKGELGGGGVLGTFASASSDGVVRVWDGRMIQWRGSGGDGGANGASNIAPSTATSTPPTGCLSSYNTRARITCLTVVAPPPASLAKSKAAKKKARQAAEVRAAAALAAEAAKQQSKKAKRKSEEAKVEEAGVEKTGDAKPKKKVRVTFKTK